MRVRKALIAALRGRFWQAVRMFEHEHGGTYPKGQWHRWRKADQRHKRQMAALRRMGYRVHPEAYNLPRRLVR